jgi:glucose/arabinose dehydrogenase
VLARGQGGLLDIAVDPRFPENRLVYVSYSEPEGNGAAGTTVPAEALMKQAWKTCR